ncbi:MAG: HipA N-terminal domain-containing protein [Gammaproteobacteria bacterium]
MRYKIDPERLEVYAETAKRRYFVGVLSYRPENDTYEFLYDHDYMRLRSAISLGPDIPFQNLPVVSKIGRLFGTMEDRIPSKENPAYVDYCHSQGISPKEKNKIILLATIGRRGPSSFVFEPVLINMDDTRQQLINFRKSLALTRWDFAKAFDFSEITIQKIENGQTRDHNILRLIDLMLNNRDVALAQLEITGKHVHAEVRTRLFHYFKRMADIS